MFQKPNAPLACDLLLYVELFATLPPKKSCTAADERVVDPAMKLAKGGDDGGKLRIFRKTERARARDMHMTVDTLGATQATLTSLPNACSDDREETSRSSPRASPRARQQAQGWKIRSTFFTPTCFTFEGLCE